MPWTFAHAAAVLPFRLGGFARLPLSALVVGSVSPDIGYYFGQFALATRAHTMFEGLLLCIPIGLLTLLIVQLLKPSIRNILPQPHRGMLSGGVAAGPFSSVRAACLAILALAIGAATHMVWDSFTHVSGWVVIRYPARQESVPLGGLSVPAYKLLQHLSTAFGIVALVLAYFVSLRRTPGYPWTSSANEQRWRIVLLAVLACAALVIAALLLSLDGRSRSTGAFIFHFTLTATTIFATLFVGAGFVFRRRA
ncbi:DUF4184 family protein [Massilia glaciei]|uniref:DUF4184 domain-containing protein n=1 Tax=Massilia glaciei TaxID=1524097 RepID=A0A2U2HH05_9BURK|nr:DUF4184 family protein [Massilia glaciei]PWF44701.1 DUF4184 domain-containing protein [Massilia glaciei]